MTDPQHAQPFDGFTIDEPPPVTVGAVYHATLIALSSKAIDTEDGERRIVIWEFLFDGDGGETVRLDGITSTATGAKSKAYGWLVALAGADAVTPGASFPAKQLIGRECQVTIGLTKKGYPNVAALTALPRSPRPKAPTEPTA